MISSSIELYDLDPQIRSLITAELQKDEEIAWIGQPIPRFFTKQSVPTFLFGIPFTAFSIFWMVSAYSMSDGSSGFFLFGIPFLLVGSSFLLSPFWLKRIAKRSYYVLTNQRALLMMGGLFGGTANNIRSFYPNQLNDLRRTQKSDGSGDLIFTVDISHTSEGHRSKDVGFLAIAEVKAIEDAVRQLIENSKLSAADESHPT